MLTLDGGKYLWDDRGSDLLAGICCQGCESPALSKAK
jgi:hypothetical protein